MERKEPSWKPAGLHPLPLEVHYLSTLDETVKTHGPGGSVLRLVGPLYISYRCLRSRMNSWNSIIDSNGLQPNGDGLQPTSDGLQPGMTSMTSTLLSTLYNLLLIAPLVHIPGPFEKGDSIPIACADLY